MSENQPKFGLTTGTVVIVANVIGTGVFAALGYQLADFTSVFVLLMLWVVGGLVAVCGSLSYAELAARYPESGGEYQYLRSMVHPAVGFLAGVASTVLGFGGPIALVAILFGTYLNSVYPSVPIVASGVIAIVFVTFFHILNFKTSSVSLVVLTALKLGLMVVFCTVCLFAVGETQPFDVIPRDNDISAMFSAPFVVALVYVYYAYMGWNSVCYLSGDMETSRNEITKAILIGVVVVIAVYLLLNVTFLAVAPQSALVGQLDLVYVVAEYALGQRFADFVGIGMSALLLSTLAAMILAGSRVLHRVSEHEKLLGFFEKKKQNHVPVRAVVAQSAIAILFLFVFGEFGDILVFATFTLITNALLTVAAFVVVRYRDPNPNLSFRTPLFPIPPIVFVVFSLTTWVFLLTVETFHSLLGLAFSATFFLLYFVLPRDAEEAQSST